MDQKAISTINLRGYISNLFVLAIAIMLVYLAKRNYMHQSPIGPISDRPRTQQFAPISDQPRTQQFAPISDRPRTQQFALENFVPNVPQTPIGNGKPLEATTQSVEGGYPQGQPMVYKAQMWPARIPYQPKPNTPCTTNQSNDKVECPGAIGVCQDGVCTPGKFNRTVFGVPVS